MTSNYVITRLILENINFGVHAFQAVVTSWRGSEIDNAPCIILIATYIDLAKGEEIMDGVLTAS